MWVCVCVRYSVRTPFGSTTMNGRRSGGIFSSTFPPVWPSSPSLTSSSTNINMTTPGHTHTHSRISCIKRIFPLLRLCCVRCVGGGAAATATVGTLERESRVFVGKRCLQCAVPRPCTTFWQIFKRIMAITAFYTLMHTYTYRGRQVPYWDWRRRYLSNF